VVAVVVVLVSDHPRTPGALSLHYDIVVNTETYPGERAEAVVLMAYLAKFGACR